MSCIGCRCRWWHLSLLEWHGYRPRGDVHVNIVHGDRSLDMTSWCWVIKCRWQHWATSVWWYYSRTWSQAPTWKTLGISCLVIPWQWRHLHVVSLLKAFLSVCLDLIFWVKTHDLTFSVWIWQWWRLRDIFLLQALLLNNLFVKDHVLQGWCCCCLLLRVMIASTWPFDVMFLFLY